MYLIIKHLHLLCVTLSIGLFVWRASRSYWLPSQPLRRWQRLTVHGIDTLLLATGLSLAHLVRAWPWQQTWMAWKWSLILAYILTAMWALRPQRAPATRLGALTACGLLLVWIIGLARTHRPLWWLG